MDRLYCTIADVIKDLELAGLSDEAGLLQHIRSASQWIDDEAGMFLPYTAAKTFRGSGFDTLWIPPLLALTSITVDGEALDEDDYDLEPLDRHWEHGPYTCVRLAYDETASRAWAKTWEIVITGTWGLYDLTAATGLTVPVGDLAADATSLAVSDGTKLSPGMIIRIDSEQILVKESGAFTDSTTTTAEALDNSEEEVDLADGTKVNAGELMRINFEQMQSLEIQTNTVLVKRGMNRSTIVEHLTGQAVYVRRTFTLVRGINGTTAAAHSAGAVIYQVQPPADVNYLARQMAALNLKKAETSFVGRAGNAEAGESFFISEFPKTAIAKILGHYRIVRP